MSVAAGRRTKAAGTTADYHASHVAGLSCSTLVEAGPPRACVHDRFVLLTLTAGEALVWCRGERHALRPGSVLMLEPGEVHRDLEKSAYEASLVLLREDLVAALRGKAAGSRFSTSLSRCAALSSAATTLVEAVRAGHDTDMQERRARQLFELLAPFWTESAPRPDPPLVARARRALSQTLAANVSLEQLAAHLHCAPSYLCRVFSEHTGVGPHAYQLQQRVLEAGRLIENGRTVAKAAAITGFGDASHLRRHFQRRFAVAPGRYQQALALNARRSPREVTIREARP